MNKVMYAFKGMIREISHDAMLVMACIAPIIASFAFKFGIPKLEYILVKYMGVSEILTPFYSLFDCFLLMVTPIMFLFIAAMVILDEIDENMTEFFAVTPVGKMGYVISRLGIPAGAAFVICIPIGILFTLSPVSIVKIIGLSLGTVLTGLICAILIVSLSSNRVEGMALGKLSGLIMMGVVIPYFITEKISYIAGILPSFWIGKYMQNGGLLNLVLIVALSFIWIAFLWRKFKRK